MATRTQKKTTPKKVRDARLRTVRDVFLVSASMGVVMLACGIVLDSDGLALFGGAAAFVSMFMLGMCFEKNRPKRK